MRATTILIAALLPAAAALAACSSDGQDSSVPANRAGGLSYVSLLSALPRTLAPVFFGFVAANFGTGLAFGLVAVGLAAALGLILTLRQKGLAA